MRQFTKNNNSNPHRDDGRLQFNDMRYGVYNASKAGVTADDYIFKFIVKKDGSGQYQLDGDAGRPPKGKEREMMSLLWTRIKGI